MFLLVAHLDYGLVFVLCVSKCDVSSIQLMKHPQDEGEISSFSACQSQLEFCLLSNKSEHTPFFTFCILTMT